MDALKIPDPILITGPPRSGTSLVAGLIHLGGAWGGEMIGPHPENPRGFFENRAIKQDVFEPYLFGLGYDLLGKREIPAHRERRIHGLREKIAQILIDQGYTGGPWFYKNPMMALVYSAWQHEFTAAKWIFVRRDLNANIKSCQRTSWMRGLNTEHAWMEYLFEYHGRMNRMMPKVSYRNIWTEPIIAGNLDELEKCFTWLGLDYDPDRIREFIMPESWG